MGKGIWKSQFLCVINKIEHSLLCFPSYVTPTHTYVYAHPTTHYSSPTTCQRLPSMPSTTYSWSRSRVTTPFPSVSTTTPFQGISQLRWVIHTHYI